MKSKSEGPQQLVESGYTQLTNRVLNNHYYITITWWDFT